MSDAPKNSATDRLEAMEGRAIEHTRKALDYMEEYGVEPEGNVRPFLSPSERQTEIDRLPYEHDEKQTVVYETEPGEFTALCPFSGPVLGAAGLRDEGRHESCTTRPAAHPGPRSSWGRHRAAHPEATYGPTGCIAASGGRSSPR